MLFSLLCLLCLQVWNLAYVNGQLISGSIDSTLRVWNVSTCPT